MLICQVFWELKQERDVVNEQTASPPLPMFHNTSCIPEVASMYGVYKI
jgi:hypothetical protein